MINLRRYSGILGVAVIWTAVVVSMRRAGLGLVDSRPLSFLGVYPSTARIFSFGLLISSVFFVIFAFHIKNVFKVNNRFLVYFLIGQVGQVVAAIAPYGIKSNYRLLHTIAAFVLAFSLPFLIHAFFRSQIKKPYYFFYKILFEFELITFFIGMSLITMTKGFAPIGEVLSTIGFHVWIICVTAFGNRKLKAVSSN